MSALRERLRTSRDALRLAFSNADLRRLQLAQAGSLHGSWAYSVGLAVFAYQAGGATGVAIVTLFRIIPARDRVAVHVDARRPPRTSARHARVGHHARRGHGRDGAGRLGGRARHIVYVLAARSAVGATAFRPAQRALLPGLARTPEELTASNVAASTIESVGVFVGPALGGLLLAVTDVATVFAVNGLTFLWSALMIMPARRRRAEREAPPAPKARARQFFRAAAQGFGVVAREPGVRAIVLLTGAQVLVYGANSVLIVVLAFDVLDIGESGVGYLNAALGIGGLVGSVAALALVGHRRLAAVFGVRSRSGACRSSRSASRPRSSSPPLFAASSGSPTRSSTSRADDPPALGSGRGASRACSACSSW